MRSLFAGLTLACIAASAPLAPAWAQPVNDDPDGSKWWAHVEKLATDEMEGRFTGSAGYLKAAQLVASTFESYGLKPAGANGTWFQPVNFKVQRVVAERSSLALVDGSDTIPLTLGQDAYLTNRVPQPQAIEAPLVFIGYGLHMPEVGHDDFAGMDLKGKIVVVMNGGPREVSAALKSHARRAETWKALEKAGAVGMVSLLNPKSMDIPWERQVGNAVSPGMYLADPKLQETKGPQFTATINPAQAEKLFAKSGHTYAQVLALADAQGSMPRFPLNLVLKATVTAETTDTTSPNVVALLEGSDPKLKSEYVVLTGHLDGLGVNATGSGDRINNGALDNAAGIASMLEAARRIQAQGLKPKRSILFVAVTAEERGLLGSQAFAFDPTVPRSQIVANINIDMALPLWPFTAITALGEPESTLGADVRAVAQAQGVRVLPDPQPDRNLFIRSDQYNFIRTGVPALALKLGFELGTPEERLQQAWLRERYHAPADDLSQPVDKVAATKLNQYLEALLLRVADAPERPKWLETSFFRRFAQGGSSTAAAQ
jgi:Zn-dependent M28 family amino/carboxypeptidase